MIKTLLIFLAVVVLGGGYAIYYEKSVQENKIAQNYQELKNRENADNNSSVKKIAFSEFIKGGGTYECSVTSYLSDMENKGTIYIGGDKIKGEFSTIAEGQSIDSNVIMRDGFMYLWQSASTTGTQIQLKEQTETSNTFTWDPNQIGDYDCKPWIYEESKFTLPASIKFIKQ